MPIIWWFLVVAIATGAVVWAVLSAYMQVRHRLKRSENQHPELAHEPEAGQQR